MEYFRFDDEFFIDDDEDDFVQEIQEEVELSFINTLRNPRRRAHEYPDFFFEGLTESEFFTRFRFQKRTVFEVIFPLVQNELGEINTDQRGCPIPPLLKLLAVLRFYATGSFQAVCGDLTCISQPTMSRLVKDVSELLATATHRFVKFPEGPQAAETKRKFWSLKKFPGVIGCIDCTHIPIQKPSADANAELFRNRKGKLSLNVQAICGPDLQIYDIVARWPGSAHDSRIFDNSSVKLRFDSGALKGILLGDSGYAQSEYLFTPVPTPTSDSEERYNKAHIRTRQSVERMFGVWKRRFPCLSKTLATKVNTSIRIILACAVLHNLGIIHGDIHTQHYAAPAQHDVDVVTAPQAGPLIRRGAVIRAAFIETHFTR